MSDALADLSAAGVSVWLDDLSRKRLTSGDLASLIAEKHVVGVTTNPTIFAKALEDSEVYATLISDLSLRDITVEEAARSVPTAEVRVGWEVLRPL